MWGGGCLKRNEKAERKGGGMYLRTSVIGRERLKTPYEVSRGVRGGVGVSERMCVEAWVYEV